MNKKTSTAPNPDGLLEREEGNSQKKELPAPPRTLGLLCLWQGKSSSLDRAGDNKRAASTWMNFTRLLFELLIKALEGRV